MPAKLVGSALFVLADDYRTRTRLEQLQALLDEWVPTRSISIDISAPHRRPAGPWILVLFHWRVAEAPFLKDSNVPLVDPLVLCTARYQTRVEINSPNQAEEIFAPHAKH